METANIITINTDDKNLAEVIKKIIAEAGLTIADLFDDDEVCDHIHESGMPADVVYDEDDILDCGCVTDKIQELEDQIAELEERNDELDAEKTELDHDTEILKKKWRELDKKVAEFRDHDMKRVDELMRQLAEFREWNEKMKVNTCEEWCRRCGTWEMKGGRYEDIDQTRIVKDAKWGCVCEDCHHELDNPDHEVCQMCVCCKDCGCCECEEENDDIVEGQIVDDEE
jgi:predicted nuclease with TOPRIM domain